MRHPVTISNATYCPAFAVLVLLPDGLTDFGVYFYFVMIFFAFTLCFFTTFLFSNFFFFETATRWKWTVSISLFARSFMPLLNLSSNPSAHNFGSRLNLSCSSIFIFLFCFCLYWCQHIKDFLAVLQLPPLSFRMRVVASNRIFIGNGWMVNEWCVGSLFHTPTHIHTYDRMCVHPFLTSNYVVTNLWTHVNDLFMSQYRA